MILYIPLINIEATIKVNIQALFQAIRSKIMMLQQGDYVKIALRKKDPNLRFVRVAENIHPKSIPVIYAAKKDAIGEECLIVNVKQLLYIKKSFLIST